MEHTGYSPDDFNAQEDGEDHDIDRLLVFLYPK
jgi:hypothetical protein